MLVVELVDVVLVEVVYVEVELVELVLVVLVLEVDVLDVLVLVELVLEVEVELVLVVEVLEVLVLDVEVLDVEVELVLVVVVVPVSARSTIASRVCSTKNTRTMNPPSATTSLVAVFASLRLPQRMCFRAKSYSTVSQSGTSMNVYAPSNTSSVTISLAGTASARVFSAAVVSSTSKRNSGEESSSRLSLNRIKESFVSHALY